MRRLVSTLFVGALTCVTNLACAPNLTMRTDPSFAPAAVTKIERAAATWNQYTKPSHQIAVRDDGVWQILNVEPPISSKDDDDDPRTPDLEWNGQCSRKQKKIWLHPDIQFHKGLDDHYAVTLHEMGHSLGLEHTKTGVMMPFTVSVEITPEVLAECRRVGACP